MLNSPILKIAGAKEAPVLKRPMRLHTNLSYCVLELEAMNYQYYYNHQYIKGGLFCGNFQYMYTVYIKNVYMYSTSFNFMPL